MPSRADYAEDHAGGEDDAPGEDLDENVDPEDGVDRFGGDGFPFEYFVHVVFVCEDIADEVEKCCKAEGERHD